MLIKILNYFKISKKLVSYHKFNETKIKNTISDHYLSEWRNLVIDNAYLSVHDWAEEYKGENKMGSLLTFNS